MALAADFTVPASSLQQPLTVTENLYFPSKWWFLKQLPNGLQACVTEAFCSLLKPRLHYAVAIHSAVNIYFITTS